MIWVIITHVKGDYYPKKRSENYEYRPLCSGPAHWIPACAGMTEYGLYRGSTRPKAGVWTADLHARGPAIAPSAYFALAFEYFGTVRTTGYRLNYLHSVAHFS